MNIVPFTQKSRESIDRGSSGRVYMVLLYSILRTPMRSKTQVQKAILLSSDNTTVTPLTSRIEFFSRAYADIYQLSWPPHLKDVSLLLPALNSLEPNAKPKSSFHGRYMVLGWSLNLRFRSSSSSKELLVATVVPSSEWSSLNRQSHIPDNSNTPPPRSLKKSNDGPHHAGKLVEVGWPSSSTRYAPVIRTSSDAFVSSITL